MKESRTAFIAVLLCLAFIGTASGQIGKFQACQYSLVYTIYPAENRCHNDGTDYTLIPLSGLEACVLGDQIIYHGQETETDEVQFTLDLATGFTFLGDPANDKFFFLGTESYPYECYVVAGGALTVTDCVETSVKGGSSVFDDDVRVFPTSHLIKTRARGGAYDINIGFVLESEGEYEFYFSTSADADPSVTDFTSNQIQFSTLFDDSPEDFFELDARDFIDTWQVGATDFECLDELGQHFTVAKQAVWLCGETRFDEHPALYETSEEFINAATTLYVNVQTQSCALELGQNWHYDATGETCGGEDISSIANTVFLGGDNNTNNGQVVLTAANDAEACKMGDKTGEVLRDLRGNMIACRASDAHQYVTKFSDVTADAAYIAFIEAETTIDLYVNTQFEFCVTVNDDSTTNEYKLQGVYCLEKANPSTYFLDVIHAQDVGFVLVDGPVDYDSVGLTHEEGSDVYTGYLFNEQFELFEDQVESLKRPLPVFFDAAEGELIYDFYNDRCIYGANADTPYKHLTFRSDPLFKCVNPSDSAAVEDVRFDDNVIAIGKPNPWMELTATFENDKFAFALQHVTYGQDPMEMTVKVLNDDPSSPVPVSEIVVKKSTYWFSISTIQDIVFDDQSLSAIVQGASFDILAIGTKCWKGDSGPHAFTRAGDSYDCDGALGNQVAKIFGYLPKDANDGLRLEVDANDKVICKDSNDKVHKFVTTEVEDPLPGQTPFKEECVDDSDANNVVRIDLREAQRIDFSALQSEYDFAFVGANCFAEQHQESIDNGMTSYISQDEAEAAHEDYEDWVMDFAVPIACEGKVSYDWGNFGGDDDREEEFFGGFLPNPASEKAFMQHMGDFEDAEFDISMLEMDEDEHEEKMKFFGNALSKNTFHAQIYPDTTLTVDAEGNCSINFLEGTYNPSKKLCEQSPDYGVKTKDLNVVFEIQEGSVLVLNNGDCLAENTNGQIVEYTYKVTHCENKQGEKINFDSQDVEFVFASFNEGDDMEDDDGEDDTMHEDEGDMPCEYNTDMTKSFYLINLGHANGPTCLKFDDDTFSAEFDIKNVCCGGIYIDGHDFVALTSGTEYFDNNAEIKGVASLSGPNPFALNKNGDVEFFKNGKAFDFELFNLESHKGWTISGVNNIDMPHFFYVDPSESKCLDQEFNEYKLAKFEASVWGCETPYFFGSLDMVDFEYVDLREFEDLDAWSILEKKGEAGNSDQFLVDYINETCFKYVNSNGKIIDGEFDSEFHTCHLYTKPPSEVVAQTSWTYLGGYGGGSADGKLTIDLEANLCKDESDNEYNFHWGNHITGPRCISMDLEIVVDIDYHTDIVFDPAKAGAHFDAESYDFVFEPVTHTCWIKDTTWKKGTPVLGGCFEATGPKFVSYWEASAPHVYGKHQEDSNAFGVNLQEEGSSAEYKKAHGFWKNDDNTSKVTGDYKNGKVYVPDAATADKVYDIGRDHVYFFNLPNETKVYVHWTEERYISTTQDGDTVLGYIQREGTSTEIPLDNSKTIEELYAAPFVSWGEKVDMLYIDITEQFNELDHNSGINVFDSEDKWVGTVGYHLWFTSDSRHNFVSMKLRDMPFDFRKKDGSYNYIGKHFEFTNTRFVYSVFNDICLKIAPDTLATTKEATSECAKEANFDKVLVIGDHEAAGWTVKSQGPDVKGPPVCVRTAQDIDAVYPVKLPQGTIYFSADMGICTTEKPTNMEEYMDEDEEDMGPDFDEIGKDDVSDLFKAPEEHWERHITELQVTFATTGNDSYLKHVQEHSIEVHESQCAVNDGDFTHFVGKVVRPNHAIELAVLDYLFEEILRFEKKYIKEMQDDEMDEMYEGLTEEERDAVDRLERSMHPKIPFMAKSSYVMHFFMMAAMEKGMKPEERGDDWEDYRRRRRLDGHMENEQMESHIRDDLSTYERIVMEVKFHELLWVAHSTMIQCVGDDADGNTHRVHFGPQDPMVHSTDETRYHFNDFWRIEYYNAIEHPDKASTCSFDLIEGTYDATYDVCTYEIDGEEKKIEHLAENNPYVVTNIFSEYLKEKLESPDNHRQWYIDFKQEYCLKLHYSDRFEDLVLNEGQDALEPGSEDWEEQTGMLYLLGAFDYEAFEYRPGVDGVGGCFDKDDNLIDETSLNGARQDKVFKFDPYYWEVLVDLTNNECDEYLNNIQRPFHINDDNFPASSCERTDPSQGGLPLSTWTHTYLKTDGLEATYHVVNEITAGFCYVYDEQNTTWNRGEFVKGKCLNDQDQELVPQNTDANLVLKLGAESQMRSSFKKIHIDAPNDKCYLEYHISTQADETATPPVEASCESGFDELHLVRSGQFWSCATNDLATSYQLHVYDYDIGDWDEFFESHRYKRNSQDALVAVTHYYDVIEGVCVSKKDNEGNASDNWFVHPVVAGKCNGEDIPAETSVIFGGEPPVPLVHISPVPNAEGKFECKLPDDSAAGVLQTQTNMQTQVESINVPLQCYQSSTGKSILINGRSTKVSFNPVDNTADAVATQINGVDNFGLILIGKQRLAFKLNTDASPAVWEEFEINDPFIVSFKAGDSQSYSLYDFDFVDLSEDPFQSIAGMDGIDYSLNYAGDMMDDDDDDKDAVVERALSFEDKKDIMYHINYQGFFFAIDQTNSKAYDYNKKLVGDFVPAADAETPAKIVVTTQQDADGNNVEVQLMKSSYTFFNLDWQSDAIDAYVDWDNYVCYIRANSDQANNHIAQLDEEFICQLYGGEVAFDLKHKTSGVVHLGEKPEIYVVHLNKKHHQEDGFMVENFWGASGDALGFYKPNQQLIHLYDGSDPIIMNRQLYVIDANADEQIVDHYLPGVCYYKPAANKPWKQDKISQDGTSCGSQAFDKKVEFGSDVRGEIVINLLDNKCTQYVFPEEKEEMHKWNEITSRQREPVEDTFELPKDIEYKFDEDTGVCSNSKNRIPLRSAWVVEMDKIAPLLKEHKLEDENIEVLVYPNFNKSLNQMYQEEDHYFGGLDDFDLGFPTDDFGLYDEDMFSGEEGPFGPEGDMYGDMMGDMDQYDMGEFGNGDFGFDFRRMQADFGDLGDLGDFSDLGDLGDFSDLGDLGDFDPSAFDPSTFDPEAFGDLFGDGQGEMQGFDNMDPSQLAYLQYMQQQEEEKMYEKNLYVADQACAWIVSDELNNNDIVVRGFVEDKEDGTRWCVRPQHERVEGDFGIDYSEFADFGDEMEDIRRRMNDGEEHFYPQHQQCPGDDWYEKWLSKRINTTMWIWHDVEKEMKRLHEKLPQMDDYYGEDADYDNWRRRLQSGQTSAGGDLGDFGGEGDFDFGDLDLDLGEDFDPNSFFGFDEDEQGTATGDEFGDETMGFEGMEGFEGLPDELPQGFELPEDFNIPEDDFFDDVFGDYQDDPEYADIIAQAGQFDGEGDFFDQAALYQELLTKQMNRIEITDENSIEIDPMFKPHFMVDATNLNVLRNGEELPIDETSFTFGDEEHSLYQVNYSLVNYADLIAADTDLLVDYVGYKCIKNNNAVFEHYKLTYDFATKEFTCDKYPGSPLTAFTLDPTSDTIKKAIGSVGTQYKIVYGSTQCVNLADDSTSDFDSEAWTCGTDDLKSKSVDYVFEFAEADKLHLWYDAVVDVVSDTVYKFQADLTQAYAAPTVFMYDHEEDDFVNDNGDVLDYSKGFFKFMGTKSIPMDKLHEYFPDPELKIKITGTLGNDLTSTIVAPWTDSEDPEVYTSEFEYDLSHCIFYEHEDDIYLNEPSMSYYFDQKDLEAQLAADVTVVDYVSKQCFTATKRVVPIDFQNGVCTGIDGAIAPATHVIHGAYADADGNLVRAEDREGKRFQFYTKFVFHMGDANKEPHCGYGFDTFFLDLTTYSCFDECGEPFTYDDIVEDYDIQFHISNAYLNVDFVLNGDKCYGADGEVAYDAQNNTCGGDSLDGKTTTQLGEPNFKIAKNKVIIRDPIYEECYFSYDQEHFYHYDLENDKCEIDGITSCSRVDYINVGLCELEENEGFIDYSNGVCLIQEGGHIRVYEIQDFGEYCESPFGIVWADDDEYMLKEKGNPSLLVRDLPFLVKIDVDTETCSFKDLDDDTQDYAVIDEIYSFYATGILEYVLHEFSSELAEDADEDVFYFSDEYLACIHPGDGLVIPLKGSQDYIIDWGSEISASDLIIDRNACVCYTDSATSEYVDGKCQDASFYTDRIIEIVPSKKQEKLKIDILEATCEDLNGNKYDFNEEDGGKCVSKVNSDIVKDISESGFQVVNFKKYFKEDYSAEVIVLLGEGKCYVKHWDSVGDYQQSTQTCVLFASNMDEIRRLQAEEEEFNFFDGPGAEEDFEFDWGQESAPIDWINLRTEQIDVLYIGKPCVSAFPQDLDSYCTNDDFEECTLKAEFNWGKDHMPVQNDHWFNSECQYGCAVCDDEDPEEFRCEAAFEPVFEVNHEGIVYFAHEHDCGYGCTLTDKSDNTSKSAALGFAEDNGKYKLKAEDYNSNCGLGCKKCGQSITGEKYCEECEKIEDKDFNLHLAHTGRCTLEVEGKNKHLEMLSSHCGIGCADCDVFGLWPRCNACYSFFDLNETGVCKLRINDIFNDANKSDVSNGCKFPYVKNAAGDACLPWYESHRLSALDEENEPAVPFGESYEKFECVKGFTEDGYGTCIRASVHDFNSECGKGCKVCDESSGVCEMTFKDFELDFYGEISLPEVYEEQITCEHSSPLCSNDCTVCNPITYACDICDDGFHQNEDGACEEVEYDMDEFGFYDDFEIEAECYDENCLKCVDLSGVEDASGFIDEEFFRCEQCVEGMIFNTFVGMCVDEESEDYGALPANCKVGLFGECIQCYPEYTYNIFTNTCDNGCPDGQFTSEIEDALFGEIFEEDNSTNLCMYCHNSCETCENGDSCETCKNANDIIFGGLCIQPDQDKCQSLGGYFDGETCQECPDNCKDCGNDGVCVECQKNGPEPFFLVGGECTDVCESGTVPKYTYEAGEFKRKKSATCVAESQCTTCANDCIEIRASEGLTDDILCYSCSYENEPKFYHNDRCYDSTDLPANIVAAQKAKGFYADVDWLSFEPCDSQLCRQCTGNAQNCPNANECKKVIGENEDGDDICRAECEDPNCKQCDVTGTVCATCNDGFDNSATEFCVKSCSADSDCPHYCGADGECQLCEPYVEEGKAIVPNKPKKFAFYGEVTDNNTFTKLESSDQCAPQCEGFIHITATVDPAILVCYACEKDGAEQCKATQAAYDGSFNYLTADDIEASKCIQGFYLQTEGGVQVCKETCPAGTRMNDETRLCQNCSVTGCDQCNSAANKCEACEGDKVLHGGKCQDECPSGFHANDQGKCTRCPAECTKNCNKSDGTCPAEKDILKCRDQKCKTCFDNAEGKEICDSCNNTADKTFILKQGSCRSGESCGVGFQTVKGDAGEVIGCNKCLKEGCTSCNEKIDKCDSCASTHPIKLKNGTCIKQCKAGSFQTEEGCQKCSLNCKECKDNADKCTKCNDGSELINNKCYCDMTWDDNTFDYVDDVAVITFKTQQSIYFDNQNGDEYIEKYMSSQVVEFTDEELDVFFADQYELQYDDEELAAYGNDELFDSYFEFQEETEDLSNWDTFYDPELEEDFNYDYDQYTDYYQSDFTGEFDFTEEDYVMKYDESDFVGDKCLELLEPEFYESLGPDAYCEFYEEDGATYFTIEFEAQDADVDTIKEGVSFKPAAMKLEGQDCIPFNQFELSYNEDLFSEAIGGEIYADFDEIGACQSNYLEVSVTGFTFDVPQITWSISKVENLTAGQSSTVDSDCQEAFTSELEDMDPEYNDFILIQSFYSECFKGHKVTFAATIANSSGDSVTQTRQIKFKDEASATIYDLESEYVFSSYDDIYDIYFWPEFSTCGDSFEEEEVECEFRKLKEGQTDIYEKDAFHKTTFDRWMGACVYEEQLPIGKYKISIKSASQSSKLKATTTYMRVKPRAPFADYIDYPGTVRPGIAQNEFCLEYFAGEGALLKATFSVTKYPSTKMTWADIKGTDDASTDGLLEFTAGDAACVILTDLQKDQYYEIKAILDIQGGDQIYQTNPLADINDKTVEAFFYVQEPTGTALEFECYGLEGNVNFQAKNYMACEFEDDIDSLDLSEFKWELVNKASQSQSNLLVQAYQQKKASLESGTFLTLKKNTLQKNTEYRLNVDFGGIKRTYEFSTKQEIQVTFDISPKKGPQNGGTVVAVSYNKEVDEKNNVHCWVYSLDEYEFADYYTDVGVNKKEKLPFFSVGNQEIYADCYNDLGSVRTYSQKIEITAPKIDENTKKSFLNSIKKDKQGIDSMAALSFDILEQLGDDVLETTMGALAETALRDKDSMKKGDVKSVTQGIKILKNLTQACEKGKSCKSTEINETLKAIVWQEEDSSVFSTDSKVDVNAFKAEGDVQDLEFTQAIQLQESISVLQKIYSEDQNELLFLQATQNQVLFRTSTPDGQELTTSDESTGTHSTKKKISAKDATGALEQQLPGGGSVNLPSGWNTAGKSQDVEMIASQAPGKNAYTGDELEGVTFTSSFSLSMTVSKSNRAKSKQQDKLGPKGSYSTKNELSVTDLPEPIGFNVPVVETETVRRRLQDDTTETDATTDATTDGTTETDFSVRQICCYWNQEQQLAIALDKKGVDIGPCDAVFNEEAQLACEEEEDETNCYHGYGMPTYDEETGEYINDAFTEFECFSTHLTTFYVVNSNQKTAIKSDPARIYQGFLLYVIVLLDLFLVIGSFYGYKLDKHGETTTPVKKVQIANQVKDIEDNDINHTTNNMMSDHSDTTARQMTHVGATNEVRFGTVFKYIHRVTNVFVADEDLISRPMRVVNFVAAITHFLQISGAMMYLDIGAAPEIVIGLFAGLIISRLTYFGYRNLFICRQKSIHSCFTRWFTLIFVLVITFGLQGLSIYYGVDPNMTNDDYFYWTVAFCGGFFIVDFILVELIRTCIQQKFLKKSIMTGSKSGALQYALAKAYNL